MSIKQKAYFIDTTVLLDYPDVFDSLKGRIVIHTAVIKELDGHKRNENTRIAFSARKVANYLERLSNFEGFGNYKSIDQGVDIYSGSEAVRTVMVYPLYDEIEALDSPADNKILGGAIRWQREHSNEAVVLLTNDKNLKTVAKAFKIKAKPFPSYLDKVPTYVPEPPSFVPEPAKLTLIKKNAIGLTVIERKTANNQRVEKIKPDKRPISSIWGRFFGWGRKFLRSPRRNPAVQKTHNQATDDRDELIMTMDWDLYRLCRDFCNSTPK